MEDIRILVLLHKLGSKVKPGMITRDEWMSGCESLNVDSIAKFQALLPSLDTGFMVDKEFRDFYKVRKILFENFFIYKMIMIIDDIHD